MPTLTTAATATERLRLATLVHLGQTLFIHRSLTCDLGVIRSFRHSPDGGSTLVDEGPD
ncbi:hypothetical protein [Streptomyces sp. NPDC002164]|uniref:hypothetical protein n=1 Tax=Streptomyces sp. NPDC002164 TaxID=3364633 RepID=UPI0036BB12DF